MSFTFKFKFTHISSFQRVFHFSLRIVYPMGKFFIINFATSIVGKNSWGKNTKNSIVRIKLWEPNSRVISCVRRALIFPKIYSMGILLYLLFFFPLARYEERTKNALIRRSHYGSGGTLSTNLSTQCRQTVFFTIPNFWRKNQPKIFVGGLRSPCYQCWSQKREQGQNVWG